LVVSIVVAVDCSSLGLILLVVVSSCGSRSVGWFIGLSIGKYVDEPFIELRAIEEWADDKDDDDEDDDDDEEEEDEEDDDDDDDDDEDDDDDDDDDDDKDPEASFVSSSSMTCTTNTSSSFPSIEFIPKGSVVVDFVCSSDSSTL